MRRALAVVLAALCALAVIAPDVGVARAQPGPGAARREKLRQKIKAMRAWILTEELELDDAQAAKLVPVLSKSDDDMAKLLVERNQIRRQIDAAVASDESKIDGLIDKLVANQQARWDVEQKRFAELRKLLTPKQTAQLVVILPDLDRRILKGLRNAGPARELLDGGDGDADSGDVTPPPPPPRRRGKRQPP